MFKVGDLIVIKPLIGNEEDYPCVYVPSMAEYAGKTAKILTKMPLKKNEKNRKYYNGDDYCYLLDIDHMEYYWHSSMFTIFNLNPHFINLKLFI